MGWVPFLIFLSMNWVGSAEFTLLWASSAISSTPIFRQMKELVCFLNGREWKSFCLLQYEEKVREMGQWRIEEEDDNMFSNIFLRYHLRRKAAAVMQFPGDFFFMAGRKLHYVCISSFVFLGISYKVLCGRIRVYAFHVVILARIKKNKNTRIHWKCFHTDEF